MKSLFRYYLINLGALFLTSQIIKGLTYTGGWQTLLLAAGVFTVINLVLVPLLKILFLPLNLLTLGLFSWIINVLALYALTAVVPQIKLLPYFFPGYTYSGFSIPAANLTTFWVAIISSFLIGFFIHLLHFLID